MKDSGMTDKEVISVYVVSHKDFKPPLNAIYKPIAVGSLSDNAPKGFISDSRGIGISEKNPSYCELTALYWIWKNDHETSIVGLCHYRRYFTNSHFSTNCKHFLSKKDIDGILKDADVIVPTKTIWKDANVGEAYYTHGQGKRKDLKLLYDVIYKVCPSYIQDFKKLLIQIVHIIATCLLPEDKYSIRIATGYFHCSVRLKHGLISLAIQKKKLEYLAIFLKFYLTCGCNMVILGCMKYMW